MTLRVAFRGHPSPQRARDIGMETFNYMKALYGATSKQLALGSAMERLIRDCPIEQLRGEAAVIADTRAAWIEAANVARTHGCAAEEREALGVVACLTGPLEIARYRLG